MVSEDLLKKAVAAFNALSPEQQAEMLEEQRQSWVRGNVGLSRDERGMTSPVMPRPAPAATDTGLETIGFVPPMFVEGKGEGYSDIFRSVRISENHVAVVTRSQAEELLAAERAEKEKLEAAWLEAEGVISDLKADNAELTARVKELEADLKTFQDGTADLVNEKIDAEFKAVDLEAKLAAAEKALEHLTLHANSLALADIDRTRGRTGFWKALKEARAVLGGKPS